MSSTSSGTDQLRCTAEHSWITRTHHANSGSSVGTSAVITEIVPAERLLQVGNEDGKRGRQQDGIHQALKVSFSLSTITGERLRPA